MASPDSANQGGLYLSVHTKFVFAFAISIAWLAFSLWVAIPWMRDLAGLSDWAIAVFAVGGIALVPGFMNAFLITSLMMDRRPPRSRLTEYPAVTILIAAFNEATSIAATIHSIQRLRYPGPFEVIVIDDGSTDATADIVDAISFPWLSLLRQPKNRGKSAALNRGLSEARFALIVTLDADSYLTPTRWNTSLNAMSRIPPIRAPRSRLPVTADSYCARATIVRPVSPTIPTMRIGLQVPRWWCRFGKLIRALNPTALPAISPQ